MRTLNKLLATAMALVVPLCTWAQSEIEPNNTSTQATPLTYNTAMTGSTGTCSPTDNSVDYFSFTPPQQGVLRITASLSNTGGTALPVSFTVRAASTSVIQTSVLTAGANGVPTAGQFDVLCHGTANYLVSIANPSGSVCTNYTFSYSVIAPVYANDAEPNNNSVTAVTVAPNTWQQGQADFRDGDNSDYYRLDLPTNGVLNIEWEAEHAGATTGQTATITLRSTSTSVVQSWTVPVGAGSVPLTDLVTSTCRSKDNYYLLSVSSGVCGTSYRFRYNVAPAVFSEDTEPNDGSTTALLLAPNTPQDGQLNFLTYGENSDYYRIDLPTNGILNIQWQAENVGAAGTATVTLRQPSTSVVQTWTAGVGANSIAVPEVLGLACRGNSNYYLISIASNVCGMSYRFSYSVTPPVFANDPEPNDASGAATVLAHSTQQTGQINFSTFGENSDYYRIHLPSNGIFNLQWEAEHSGDTPGTATATLRQTSTSVVQSWTLGVGANSTPASESVSRNCSGNGQDYLLSFAGGTCGISYRFSYTVTPPVFGINPVAGTSSGTAPTIDLASANVTGQKNFQFGPTDQWYGINHGGGPIVLNMQAEHAGAAAADYIVRLRAPSTFVYQTVMVSAGGNSLALPAQVDFGTRPAGAYLISIEDGPCGMSFKINCNDDDADGVCNAFDLCANTPTGEGVNSNGCSCTQVTIDDGDVCTLDVCLNGDVTNTFQDADGDLTCDANDGCPNDPNKIAPGQCGCGAADTDTDGDLTADCNDGCPNDANKIAPGICGCGVSDVDTDGDLTADCNDGCPADPNKTSPGTCGCGVSDVDTDGDLTADCNDGCPADPNKTSPGTCGCGVSDVDTDGDLTADCNDGCPADPNKTSPGTCGCGVSDVDTDGDLTADCNDGCPADPNKTSPGTCGCGVADTDTDGDGTPDCNDACPLLANLAPGNSCDDGNANTINDVVGANCVCAGTLLGNDCLGVPGGSALPGTSCNDNDACTVNDVYQGNCLCAGTFADADNDGTCDANDLCPGGPEPGSACNDNNANTENDLVGGDCVCAGTPINTCTEDLVLTFNLDAFGSETTWEVRDQATNDIVEQGGPYADGAAGTMVANLCVPIGCYQLSVFDASGNGISGGGYVLTDDHGRRIVDADGQFGSTSSISAGVHPDFCVPVGPTNLKSNWCDRADLTPQSVVRCREVAGATGYQFWFYDPHGSFNRRILRSNNSCSLTGTSGPMPFGLELNVRVRAMVDGHYTGFGKTCTMVGNNSFSGGSLQLA
ncbi:MAG: hypothetical protein ABI599_09025, partial [Flavobacteriales bacterium]